MPKRRTCEIITMHSHKTKPTQKPLERHHPGRALWSLCLSRTGSLGVKDRSLEAPLCHQLSPLSPGHNGRAEVRGLGPRCSGCASGASPASPGDRGPCNASHTDPPVLPQKAGCLCGPPHSEPEERRCPLSF